MSRVQMHYVDIDQNIHCAMLVCPYHPSHHAILVGSMTHRGKILRQQIVTQHNMLRTMLHFPNRQQSMDNALAARTNSPAGKHQRTDL